MSVLWFLSVRYSAQLRLHVRRRAARPAEAQPAAAHRLPRVLELLQLQQRAHHRRVVLIQQRVAHLRRRGDPSRVAMASQLRWDAAGETAAPGCAPGGGLRCPTCPAEAGGATESRSRWSARERIVLFDQGEGQRAARDERMGRGAQGWVPASRTSHSRPRRCSTLPPSKAAWRLRRPRPPGQRCFWSVSGRKTRARQRVWVDTWRPSRCPSPPAGRLRTESAGGWAGLPPRTDTLRAAAK